MCIKFLFSIQIQHGATTISKWVSSLNSLNEILPWLTYLYALGNPTLNKANHRCRPCRECLQHSKLCNNNNLKFSLKWPCFKTVSRFLDENTSILTKITTVRLPLGESASWHRFSWNSWSKKQKIFWKKLNISPHSWWHLFLCGHEPFIYIPLILNSRKQRWSMSRKLRIVKKKLEERSAIVVIFLW